MVPQEERALDLVLWGATGFTGQLVAEYLVKHGPEGLRWAIAGRNKEKLERLLERLETKAPPSILVATLDDASSLEAMTADSRVLISTAGPYSRLGTPVLTACVKTDTDYCDLTGETPWIRQSIDRFHNQARDQGTRIVHCCGYDSIPSDLGVYLLHLAAQSEGLCLEQVKLFSAHSRGGISGGTIASLFEVLDQSRDRQVRQVLGNPYSLNPSEQMHGPDGSDPSSVRFDRDLERWTGPFVMAAVNSRIVRRSNALLDFAYGPELRYSEAMSTRKGLGGWWRAQKLRWGIGLFMLLAMPRPTRRLLQRRFLPRPGQGPDRKQVESGCFQMLLVGQAVGSEGEARRLLGVVEGQRDPGYGETAKMLGESALCLALDRSHLPENAGVLTPASAMGSALVRRLRRAGMTLEVHSWPAGSDVLEQVEAAYRSRR
jgi:short subunit dehydrogenase-like uncharacterized protein